MQTYQQLLETYPAEEWVEETDEEDGYCLTCTDGESCRAAINTDVTDIQAELRHQMLFPTPLQILTWLHANGYSSLTHGITQLADMFCRVEPEEN